MIGKSNNFNFQQNFNILQAGSSTFRLNILKSYYLSANNKYLNKGFCISPPELYSCQCGEGSKSAFRSTEMNKVKNPNNHHFLDFLSGVWSQFSEGEGLHLVSLGLMTSVYNPSCCAVSVSFVPANYIIVFRWKVQVASKGLYFRKPKVSLISCFEFFFYQCSI